MVDLQDGKCCVFFKVYRVLFILRKKDTCFFSGLYTFLGYRQRETRSAGFFVVDFNLAGWQRITLSNLKPLLTFTSETWHIKKEEIVNDRKRIYRANRTYQSFKG